jgi:hypothetical protein
MSTQPVALHALGKRPCPEEIIEHAASAAKLSPVAVEHLWEVLLPCVLDPMSAPLARALSQFSLRHEIAEADLGRTIRSCRFLVREAAAIDLPVAAFAEDFANLFPRPPELAQLVVGRFDELKERVRTQLYLAALEEHGAVLADVAWRVDLVATTSQAARLLLPVAMLTLSYRDGGVDRRLTLQVPGDVMKKLRDVTEIVLK